MAPSGTVLTDRETPRHTWMGRGWAAGIPGAASVWLAGECGWRRVFRRVGTCTDGKAVRPLAEASLPLPPEGGTQTETPE